MPDEIPVVPQEYSAVLPDEIPAEVSEDDGNKKSLEESGTAKPEDVLTVVIEESKVVTEKLETGAPNEVEKESLPEYPSCVVLEKSLDEESPCVVPASPVDEKTNGFVSEVIEDTKRHSHYEAAKEEIEQSIDFIKAKLKTPSPPIAPPKAHRGGKGPIERSEQNKEIENIEGMKLGIETELQSLGSIESTSKKDGKKEVAIAPAPTTQELTESFANSVKKDDSTPTDTIPPVRPLRKKQLQIPAWRPPKQNLVEYIFGCFLPKRT